jgi:hypothetical protein
MATGTEKYYQAKALLPGGSGAAFEAHVNLGRGRARVR